MASIRMTLLNPPSPAQRVSIKDTMGGFGQLLKSESTTVMPTLDVLYTASMLREKGITFDCIEAVAMFLDLDEVLRRLAKDTIDIIAIRVSTPTFDWDLEVAKTIRKQTGSKIILFGPHIAVAYDGLLDHPYVDAIVFGECEETLTELAEKNDFAGVTGLWFSDDSGHLVKNAGRERIADLDAMPFPAWELMPMANFSSGGMPEPFATMLTSRGCPHNCSYCPYPVSQGLKWRHRSALSVVKEMKWLETEHGVKSILFRDPEFSIKKSRTADICDAIVQQGVKVAWRCETRMENLTPEIIEKLGDAGCIGVNMGVESTNKEVLASMNRKSTYLKDARNVIRLCRQKGIQTTCFFIVGLPRDTIARSLTTIKDALVWNPSHASFTVATPYPGTELEVWAKSNGYLLEYSYADLTSGKAIRFLTQMYARFSLRQVGHRSGKTLRMCSCSIRSGAVVCRSVDGRLRGPLSWWGPARRQPDQTQAADSMSLTWRRTVKASRTRPRLSPTFYAGAEPSLTVQPPWNWQPHHDSAVCCGRTFREPATPLQIRTVFFSHVSH